PSPHPGENGHGYWTARAGFEWTPRPVDRRSLFARSGPQRGPARHSMPGARVDARHAAQAIHALPALTRAQNIHVLLAAIPVAKARLAAAGAAMLRSPAFSRPRQ